jgi:DNA modification methylase
MNQSEFFLKDQKGADNGHVECLGKTFANDKERRQYYLAILAEKLKDPEFRKIEGFPIGEDEDILNLSDPPYYTACPNPWIADFIADWESQKPQREAGYHYHREPFAADVSEGKNDPIYNAHSYHTKVPHKAIMRYILHYTEPGDIVFDGFAGTGMTGVAAQMCGDKDVVLSLGYQVQADGTILQEESDEDGNNTRVAFSKLGVRYAVLNDLSPAATFIAYNYTTPVDILFLDKEVEQILKKVKQECGWMYETVHSDGKTIGRINYTVWSEVFSCPQCTNEIIYYDSAFARKGNETVFKKDFLCPGCGVLCSKTTSSKYHVQKIDRVFTSYTDSITGTTVKQQKRIPVIINYKIGTKRYEKRVTEDDIKQLNNIKNISFDSQFVASDRMPAGDESRRNDSEGITHVHHFYIYRTLVVLSKILKFSNLPQINFLIGSILPKLTILNRYMPQHGGRALVGPMANTLYVPPVNVENNVIDQTEFQIKKIIKALNHLKGSIVTTQGAQKINVLDSSMDYLFFDPPFGANIMYSELSFVRESWLKVFTNNIPEAIENKTQNKSIDKYRDLMLFCFKEAYRVLKPGRWMTVEFSNTKSSVWNSIQTALTDAGFIISSVTALDKTRGGLHSMLGPTSVKQDLIISAYKPNGGFEQRFINESNEDGVWNFIRTHLGYLPVSKKQDNELVKIPERDPRILFDQVVAYFVRNLRDVPLSSKEFQNGLLERFSERDGMIFLPEQVAQYDKVRISSSQLRQLDIFVDDEASSIEWLRQLLNDKPQTYQDIHPKFINELLGWKKSELQLELSIFLEQNFIKYDGEGRLPSQIHSYLSTNFKDLRNLSKNDPALLKKAKDRWYVPNPEREEDLQKLREWSLLKQFAEYKTQTGKKLKLVRMEALRCGFKKAWQDRDYTTIIDVAEKIPQDLLQEDPKLLMWYDQAQTRSGNPF